jgi:hypothetical protein
LAVDAGENPLYRRLAEPQSQSKCSGEKKNLLLCQESNCFLSCPAHSQSLTELLQLSTEVRVSFYIYI